MQKLSSGHSVGEVTIRQSKQRMLHDFDAPEKEGLKITFENENLVAETIDKVGGTKVSPGSSATSAIALANVCAFR